MKLKKGDRVVVTVGKDKGRKGKVEKIMPGVGKALIPGINVYKRHAKPRGEKQPGGIVDIVRDGMNGFLVEPKNSTELADKIQWLISNEGLGQEMGKQGRLFVEERFSWQAKAQEILEIYQVLLREREKEKLTY